MEMRGGELIVAGQEPATVRGCARPSGGTEGAEQDLGGRANGRDVDWLLKLEDVALRRKPREVVIEQLGGLRVRQPQGRAAARRLLADELKQAERRHVDIGLIDGNLPSTGPSADHSMPMIFNLTPSRPSLMLASTRKTNLGWDRSANLIKIADGTLGQPERVARSPLTSQIRLDELSTIGRYLGTLATDLRIRLYPEHPYA
jgi:hypothetical protein